MLAFLLATETTYDTVPLPFGSAVASGIDAAGRVVGVTNGQTPPTAFVWQDGRVLWSSHDYRQTIGPNRRGQIALLGREGLFLLEDGRVRACPGAAVPRRLVGIDDAGVVAFEPEGGDWLATWPVAARGEPRFDVRASPLFRGLPPPASSLFALALAADGSFAASYFRSDLGHGMMTPGDRTIVRTPRRTDLFQQSPPMFVSGPRESRAKFDDSHLIMVQALGPDGTVAGSKAGGPESPRKPLALLSNSRPLPRPRERLGLWREGIWHELPLPSPKPGGTVSGSVAALNRRGEAVGTVAFHRPRNPSAPDQVAALWSGSRFVDLNGRLDRTRWRAWYALAINERGDVVVAAQRVGGPPSDESLLLLRRRG